MLVEAAEMGNPDALYELGCRLRVEVGHFSCLRVNVACEMFVFIASAFVSIIVYLLLGSL